MWWRSLRAAVAAAIALGLLLAGLGAPGAHAQDPSAAPPTSLSDGGRTVSGAGKALRASQVAGLDPAGQAVTVEGTGYDEHKGVYVTFCALPPANHPPTPCGGGQDRGGASGASTWISSNPPDYAAGLTTPYGPGGSFRVTLSVEPVIGDGVDCRVVRCAIVTRNDHTRSADRSQDLFLPVDFAPVPGPDGPSPAAPPPTLPPLPTTTVADGPMEVVPTTALAPDGRSVHDGTRTLAVSDVADLDPDGAEITVTGSGFDAGLGIYVALCRAPEPGAVPGPCTAGAAAAWVASDPPDYGRDLARPYDEGGRFEVTLRVGARIDAETDCREVSCAVATRRDDTAPEDRAQDLLVPVAFAEDPASQPPAPDVDGSAAALTARDSDDGGGGVLVALAGTGVAGAAVAGALLLRRRLRRGRPGPTVPGPAEWQR